MAEFNIADTRTGTRNARILAVCQALYICAISVDLTLTGINGYQLAPNKALATLPFALITVGAAITTVFAAFLMARFGRRIGFSIGALSGAAGGLISVWAIATSDFWLFCLGTLGVGGFQAFAQYYSLAAADFVSMARKSRAISTVLAGGVIAALAGPMLANWSRGWIADVAFAGAYLMVALLALTLVVLLLSLYRDIEPTVAETTGEPLPQRPMGEIVRQPRFIVGVGTTMTASAAMLLAMTAAPLAAVACGYTIDDGAEIIQWHLIGMFAPSLFGRLVARFGVVPVLVAGALAIALAAGIAISSTTLIAFHLALLFLGLGWNFMTVSGTTLISQSYRPSERGKTQALSGLLGNAAATAATLGSGIAFQAMGWAPLNALIVPVVIVCAFGALAWARSARRRPEMDYA